MADVFVSYASQDASFAERLAHELVKRGATVFFDRGTLVAGVDFQQEIMQALKQARVVVVLLSASTRRSTWVQEELSSVIERPDGPTVVPVLLDHHAKENWVWPLVSERLGFDLSASNLSIEAVAERIATQILDRDPEFPASRSSSQRSMYLVLAVALSLLATATVFLLLLPTSDGPILSGVGTFRLELWLPVLTGAIGVLVGYLLNQWRK